MLAVLKDQPELLSCKEIESLDLIPQVNKYRRRFAYFPEVVIADGIYGTCENRKYLKENGIRFSGKKLGRPPKEIDAVTRELERLRVLEQGERNEMEGKIETVKTRYGLGKLMTKTEVTSENWVAMAIFSMNMATALRRLLLSLFYWVKNWLKSVIKLSFLNYKPAVVSLVGE
jgi:hypothetical protein